MCKTNSAIELMRLLAIAWSILYYYSTGAFGYFECTHDITKYTKAKPFESVGKKTPVGVRFSTVGKLLKID